MTSEEFTWLWELASYIATTIGVPIAVWALIRENQQSKEEAADSIYQELSDSYTDFLKLVLQNADLQLLTAVPGTATVPNSTERKMALFSILMSLFERAFLLIHTNDMSPDVQKQWESWHDYMHEWCSRKEFREMLPKLLQGEDPEFTAYLTALITSIENQNKVK